MRGFEWKWHGLVAVVLAAGAVAAIVILALSEYFSPEHVTGEEATLLSTVTGAAIGAVAAYLGAGHSRPPEPPPESGSS